MEDWAAARLARLQLATAALASAVSRAAVIEVILTHTAEELGAASVAVWLLDEEGTTVEWADGRGVDAVIPHRFARIALDSDVPGASVVRTGEPVFFTSRVQRDADWPSLADTPSSLESAAVLPLRVQGAPFGCVSFGFPLTREFDEQDRSMLEAIASQCALSIDRARLYDEERTHRELLRFLADASAAMSSILDHREVLRRLVDLVVPALAEICAVYVPEANGLRRLAFKAGRRSSAMPEESEPPVLPFDAEVPVCVTYHSGQVTEIPPFRAAVLADTPGLEQYASSFAGDETIVGFAVPITAVGGRTLGVLTLASSQRSMPHTGARRDVAREVAARAAAAIETARRFEREHQFTVALTNAILPVAPPQLAGVEAAVRYLPAERALGTVGGDWWDLAELPSGDVLIGIGDVSGHGVAAAALMARLRSAGRAFAIEGATPAEILGRLDRLVISEGDDDTIVTAVYGLYDRASGSLRWASAGHPTPLTSGPGQAELLGPVDIALGVGGHDPYHENVCRLEVGSTLVVYTDDLVERPGESLADGMARLRDAVADLGAARAADLADDLLVRLLVERRDDACLMVIRPR